MRFQSTLDSPIRLAPPGIYTLSGVVDIRVDSGQLHVKAGVFENRPELRLSKASSRLSRIVVLGHSGTISFAALRWLADLGAGMIQIDYDTSVIVASIPPGSDYPKLRRAQALAMHSLNGLEMMRALIAGKTSGQADVCRMMGNEIAARKVESFLERMRAAPSIVRLQSLESPASALYWEAWAKIPVLFARKDETKIPRQWKSFESRFSPLTNAPRKAGNPANAMLNYLYALLEAETRIAILTMGMDPGLGCMHTDQPARNSLALDLMEPARPIVDAWLLKLLLERRFARNDFYETPKGQIMLTKPLAHELTGTLPLWARAIAPIVERAANRLLSSSAPTRLTQAHRSRRGLDFAHGPLRKALSRVKSPPSSCRECGIAIPSPKRFCSPECLNRFNENVQLPKFTKAGPATLRNLRSENRDPAHGGNAAKRRSETNRHRFRVRKVWDDAHSPAERNREREQFKRDILPALALLPIRQISKATGLSLRYASLIRKGACIPSPVHYPALRKLVFSAATQTPPG
ncbi:MAG: CRISPR-associated endonuclease Cas1 [Anaerolineales bacterium]|jgi:CRISPR-associated protein Cas1